MDKVFVVMDGNEQSGYKANGKKYFQSYDSAKIWLDYYVHLLNAGITESTIFKQLAHVSSIDYVSYAIYKPVTNDFKFLYKNKQGDGVYIDSLTLA